MTISQSELIERFVQGEELPLPGASNMAARSISGHDSAAAIVSYLRYYPARRRWGDRNFNPVLLVRNDDGMMLTAFENGTARSHHRGVVRRTVSRTIRSNYSIISVEDIVVRGLCDDRSPETTAFGPSSNAILALCWDYADEIVRCSIEEYELPMDASIWKERFTQT